MPDRFAVQRAAERRVLLRCTPCGSESGRSLHGDWQELTGAIAS